MEDKKFLALIKQDYIEVRGHKILLSDVKYLVVSLFDLGDGTPFLATKRKLSTAKAGERGSGLPYGFLSISEMTDNIGETLNDKDLRDWCSGDKSILKVISESQNNNEEIVIFVRPNEFLVSFKQTIGRINRYIGKTPLIVNEAIDLVTFLDEVQIHDNKYRVHSDFFLKMISQEYKKYAKQRLGSVTLNDDDKSHIRVKIPQNLSLHDGTLIESLELQKAISELRNNQLNIINSKVKVTNAIEDLLKMIDLDLMSSKTVFGKTDKDLLDLNFYKILGKNFIEVENQIINLVDDKLSSFPIVKFKTILGKDFFGHGKNKISSPWVKIVKGESKYTGGYIQSHHGQYPVYSSNTDPETMGVCGYIDSFDYEQESIHFTSNGENAGTIFKVPKSKFSMNGDRGMFEIVRKDVDINYLFLTIKEGFSNNDFSWANKPSNERISELINIKIPEDIILSNGKLISSLAIQQGISKLIMEKKDAINGKIKALRAIQSMLELLKESVGKS